MTGISLQFIVGAPVHRHVPDGPSQQHHHVSGAQRLPHPPVHQTQTVRESGRTADKRQRLEDAGPQAQLGQVALVLQMTRHHMRTHSFSLDHCFLKSQYPSFHIFH